LMAYAKVSIPYRYATNSCNKVLSLFSCGFQFLIGTLQTGDEIISIKCPGMFQFLIGTLQTLFTPLHIIQPCTCFNSL